MTRSYLRSENAYQYLKKSYGLDIDKYGSNPIKVTNVKF